MKKIIVIGGSNIDIITKSENTFRLKDSNPGSHHISFGGVARNIAVDLKILGHEVTLLTVIPEDIFGHQMTLDAKNMGIRVIGPSVFVSTMYVSIQNQDGDLIGAVASMDAMKHLNESIIKTLESEILSHDIIICDTNVSEVALKRISQLNHSHKYIELVSIEKAKKVKPYLKNFQMIKGNEHEIQTLFDTSSHETIQQLAEQQIIIMTCGNKGVYQFGPYASFYQGPTIQPVNTSGAGDAFFAGYIDGMILGNNPLKRGYEIARRALFNHRSTIQGDNI